MQAAQLMGQQGRPPMPVMTSSNPPAGPLRPPHHSGVLPNGHQPPYQQQQHSYPNLPGGPAGMTTIRPSSSGGPPPQPPMGGGAPGGGPPPHPPGGMMMPLPHAQLKPGQFPQGPPPPQGPAAPNISNPAEKLNGMSTNGPPATFNHQQQQHHQQVGPPPGLAAMPIRPTGPAVPFGSAAEQPANPQQQGPPGPVGGLGLATLSLGPAGGPALNGQHQQAVRPLGMSNGPPGPPVPRGPGPSQGPPNPAYPTAGGVVQPPYGGPPQLQHQQGGQPPGPRPLMPGNAAGPPRPGVGMPPMGPGMPPMGGGMPPMGPGMPHTTSGMPPMGAGMPHMSSGMPPMPPMGPAGMQQQQHPGMLPARPVGMPPGSLGPQGYGGPMPGAGVPTSPGGGRRSLDPDSMPSPIAVMEEDQRSKGGQFETREKGQTPPLVTTKFVVHDYGIASPRYIRSTMYHVPNSEDIRKQTGVPFAIVVTPLARLEENETEPPISDFGPNGPVRCVRCKAYMSPFMQFIDGGRRFQCVFCKATTEVPAEYFQHLDHNGTRVDRYQRPELCLGTYECLATKDYCRDSKDPNPPAVIFAIDVSYPMVKEGVVSLICSNVKRLLQNLPRDTNCDKTKMRVGFITYDSKINFYNISGNLTQPQQLTVGDVEDMFVPLSNGFFATLEDSELVIDSLMEQIPQMFADTKETETVLGPVIQAGKEAFKAAECTGKLIIFHHNLPVAEAPGKLKNRDDRKVLGTDKEKTVLTPQTKVYNQYGQDCVGVGCSVDLFLFNNAYIDVATLSQVSRLSGGQVYKYTYFQTDIDGDRFLEDLKRNLSRPVVFDSIMRIRTSTGVRPVEFYGSFYMANSTDTELAAVTADTAIACEIKYDDKLTDEDGVYIQAALLFTSCSGQRRLRIINLALNCGPQMADVYRNCELDTIVNFTAKQAIAKLIDTNPKAVKESLVANCAQILACYRKNCASPSSVGQLILPDCMKLLPLYTNCLLKSDVLSGGPDIGCDDRALLMNAVSAMDVASTVAFFYPKLMPIHHNLEGDDDAPMMPSPIRCSIEKVQDDGVYLLDNGVYLFMYVGLAADPSWIQAVFGVQTAAQINVEEARLEERDNPISKGVRRVVDALRATRHRQCMRLAVVRQRDKLDILFRHYLCEDRAGPGSLGGSGGGNGSDSNFSYVDFLCHMHKEIRALLG